MQRKEPNIKYQYAIGQEHKHSQSLKANRNTNIIMKILLLAGMLCQKKSLHSV